MLLKLDHVELFRIRQTLDEEDKDLFSKETLLQHRITSDALQQDYLKFDCDNKPEGQFGRVQWVSTDTA